MFNASQVLTGQCVINKPDFCRGAFSQHSQRSTDDRSCTRCLSAHIRFQTVKQASCAESLSHTLPDTATLELIQQTASKVWMNSLTQSGFRIVCRHVDLHGCRNTFQPQQNHLCCFCTGQVMQLGATRQEPKGVAVSHVKHCNLDTLSVQLTWNLRRKHSCRILPARDMTLMPSAFGSKARAACKLTAK